MVRTSHFTSFFTPRVFLYSLLCTRLYQYLNNCQVVIAIANIQSITCLNNYIIGNIIKKPTLFP